MFCGYSRKDSEHHNVLFKCIHPVWLYMPPATGPCVCSWTETAAGAGDAGRGEDKLRAPLPAACVQPGGEGAWLPAENPLKDSVRGYSFPLAHCEKQKYCNANRGTKCSAVINEHGGGSLLVEESKAMLTIFPWHWDHCSAGQQQTRCSRGHLRCWQRLLPVPALVSLSNTGRLPKAETRYLAEDLSWFSES